MRTIKQVFILLYGAFMLFGLPSCGGDEDISSGKDEGSYKGHDYVDLGLPSGTLWATCNVGANIPTGFGYYYAWGETNTKADYSDDTYKWCSGYQNYTKYCDDSSYGTVDNKLTLEQSDDAAYAAWGGNWRTPTYNQWKELLDYCTIKRSGMNDVDGAVVTGPNGNYIFLPKAGWMNGTDKKTSKYWYWSSSVYPNHYNAVYYFDGGSMDNSRDDRPTGGSIRPVCKK